MNADYYTQQYVAVIDYSLGNLASINHALATAGISACLTDDPDIIKKAQAVILPGIGAFKKAIEELEKRNLVIILQDYVESGRPLIGICLGMQLLFSSSDEFGNHKGLSFIPGHVSRFPRPTLDRKNSDFRSFKVPQVGWNTISPDRGIETTSWQGTLLEGVQDKAFMYFMHSYYVTPEDKEVTLSVTEYAGIRYCSSVASGNVFGFQFHPERSGEQGLRIYRNLAKYIKNSKSFPSNKMYTHLNSPNNHNTETADS